MKRIDFHIHTVSTSYDHDFEFDMTELINHVKKYALDAIAITNHNTFCSTNYTAVTNALEEYNCIVFPGIEVSALGTHILVIGDKDNADEIESSSSLVENYLNSEDSLSYQDLLDAFPNLSQYLVIPHYRKNPQISAENLQKLSTFTSAVETSSMKKVVEINSTEEVPFAAVSFSDHRFGLKRNYSAKTIYVIVDSITIPNIKRAFADRDNIRINENGTTALELEPGVIASEKLNLIIGKRSTGKTVTLNRVFNLLDQDEVLYLKQGEIIREADPDTFVATKTKLEETRSKEYFGLWKPIVESARVYQSKTERLTTLGTYLKELNEHATTSTLATAFAECVLFSDDLIDEDQITQNFDLIDAVCTLLTDEEYKIQIDSIVGRENLKKLLRLLVDNERKKKLSFASIQKANEVISAVKKRLSTRSGQKPKPQSVFRTMAKGIYHFQKMANLLSICWTEKTIIADPDGKFTLVGTTGKLSNATAVKTALNTNTSLAGIAEKNSEDYLEHLFSTVPECLLENGLFSISYKIIDDKEASLSGGQRAEYVFLRRLSDAERFKVILIDEPESSFDNLFLDTHIADRIRKISESASVFVTTHNQVLGLSLNPNKIFYTEYDDDSKKYNLYCGELPNPELLSSEGTPVKMHETLMNMMEAGAVSYEKRVKLYEDIKD